MHKSLATPTLQTWQVARLAPGFTASGFCNRCCTWAVAFWIIRERLTAPLLGLGIPSALEGIADSGSGDRYMGVERLVLLLVQCVLSSESLLLAAQMKKVTPNRRTEPP